MLTATINTTLDIGWQTPRGVETDAVADVCYTFDGGNNLQIIEWRVTNDSGIGPHALLELIYEAVEAVADEEYAEWLADQDFDDSVGLAA
jgi:hypothetical protein